MCASRSSRSLDLADKLDRSCEKGLLHVLRAQDSRNGLVDQQEKELDPVRDHEWSEMCVIDSYYMNLTL